MTPGGSILHIIEAAHLGFARGSSRQAVQLGIHYLDVLGRHLLRRLGFGRRALLEGLQRLGFTEFCVKLLRRAAAGPSTAYSLMGS